MLLRIPAVYIYTYIVGVELTPTDLWSLSSLLTKGVNITLTSFINISNESSNSQMSTYGLFDDCINAVLHTQRPVLRVHCVWVLSVFWQQIYEKKINGTQSEDASSLTNSCLLHLCCKHCNEVKTCCALGSSPLRPCYLELSCSSWATGLGPVRVLCVCLSDSCSRTQPSVVERKTQNTKLTSRHQS